VQRSGDFAIARLGGVASSNLHRLVYCSPEIAWEPIVSHLLSVLCDPTAPQSIRVQSARVLDEILLSAPRNISNLLEEEKGDVQNRVLDALSAQVVLDKTGEPSNQVTLELRKMGLETLLKVLQTSIHTLVVGWETIFGMLTSVCRPIPGETHPPSGSSPSLSGTSRRPPPLMLGNDRGGAVLVKIAFQILTLVCDALESLDPPHLQLCISTLGAFGRQADTNVALTAAESLLWSVSDSIQGRRKAAQGRDEEYSKLWMDLLLELMGLGRDTRREVREGAIQTLFRTLQLYGTTLESETWNEVLWKVVFPLLDGLSLAMHPDPRPFDEEEDDEAEDETKIQMLPPDATWADSKILALQSTGAVFVDFGVSKLIRLSSFTRAWDAFVAHVQNAVLQDVRRVSAPALGCLARAVESASSITPGEHQDQLHYVHERTWAACEAVGNSVLLDASTKPGAERTVEAFSQESLIALIDVVNALRSSARRDATEEWEVDKLKKLMTILKGNSYRPEPKIY
jgi:hypothetical protein